MVTKPELPPKRGYVEVIDEGGNHVYKPTKETLKELENQTAQNDTDTLIVDHEYRLTLLELGVTEDAV